MAEPSRFEEHTESQKALNDRHDKELQLWRFLQGMRVLLTAGFIGATAALLAQYLSQLQLFTGTNITKLSGALAAALIAQIGVFAALAGWHIEDAIERMLRDILQRGQTIEGQLNVQNGLFGTTLHMVTGPRALVPLLLRMLYRVVFFEWFAAVMSAIGLAMYQVVWQ